MFCAGENGSPFCMGLRMFMSQKTICWKKTLGIVKKRK